MTIQLTDFADLPISLIHTNDVDAHEMVPSLLWEETFGPHSGRIAKLLEPLLKKFVLGNDFYNPEFAGDWREPTVDNVWNLRGTAAPSAVDLRRRLEVLDVMGIERQLIFSSYSIFCTSLVSSSEFQIRDSMELDLPLDEVRALGRDGLDEYNRWAATMTGLAPDRLRMVGYVVPDRTLADLVRETQHLLDAGIRAIHVPSSMAPAGLSPAAPELDEFYSMLERRQATLTIHVGGEFGFLKDPAWGRAPAFKPGRVESHELGLEPYSMATLHFPIDNYLTAMVLGGVFERHPDLRMGVIEVTARWLGPLAQSLDM